MCQNKTASLTLKRAYGLLLLCEIRLKGCVLGNLSNRENDFGALSTALQERFIPPLQTELHRCQLRDGKQKTLGDSGTRVERHLQRNSSLQIHYTVLTLDWR